MSKPKDNRKTNFAKIATHWGFLPDGTTEPWILLRTWDEKEEVLMLDAENETFYMHPDCLEEIP